jgi:hypothetical protein
MFTPATNMFQTDIEKDSRNVETAIKAMSGTPLARGSKHNPDPPTDPSQLTHQAKAKAAHTLAVQLKENPPPVPFDFVIVVP